MSVKMKIDRLASVVANIKAMAEKQLLVGIPEQKTERRPDDEDDSKAPATNALLGYIHENGSPANGIPSRPFLVPGVLSARKEVASTLKESAKQALDGDKRAVEDGLNKAGLIAQASVRDAITHGNFEPLAESTLRARAKRGRKGAKAELEARASGAAPSNATAKPLIDTGQLRNSINYVIRKK